MSSKSLITKSFAVLLAVMFIVSSFAIGISASAPSGKMTIEYDNGVVTLKLPASTIASIISNRSLSIQDIKDMIPSDMITEYQNNGIIGILTSSTVTDAIPLTTILGLVPSSVLEEVVPDYDELLDIVDVAEVINNNQIDVDALLADVTEADIIAAMIGSGYTTKAEAIDAIKAAAIAGTVSTVVDVNKAVSAVLESTDGVKTVIDSIKTDAIAEVVENIAPAKLIDAAKKMAKSFAEANSVKINGETVVSNGSISASALEKVILNVIPRKSSFDSLVNNNNILTSITIEAELATSEVVTYGLELGFYGDSADIATIVDKADGVMDLIKTYADVSIDGTDISLTISAPNKVGEIVSDILSSTSVSDATKTDIMSVMNGTIADVIDYISGMSVSDVVAIIDEIASVTTSNTVVKLVNKLDEVSVNHADACDKVREVVVSFLSSIPDSFTSQKVSDIYTSNGTFTTVLNLGVNLKSMLNTLGTSYSFLTTIANHVSDDVIPASITFTVNAPSLHKVVFHDAEGNVAFTTYLPAGVAFADVIALFPTLAGSYTFDGTTAADVMPDSDCEVFIDHIIYKVNFVQFDGTVITVEYQLGADSIVEPAIDAVLGYDATWAEYELNVSPEITVDLELTPIAGTLNRTLKFVFADGTWKNVTYTVGDKITSIKFPKNSSIKGYYVEWEKFQLSAVQNKKIHTVHEVLTPMTYDVVFVQADGTETVVSYQYGATEVSEPAVNAKEGFNGKWAKYELNSEPVIKVEAIYTAKEYTVNFKQGDGSIQKVSYEYGAKSITAPAVLEKFGYTGAWAAYELNKAEEITVEAVYTAKTFKVVFAVDNFTQVIEYTFGATSITAPEVPAKAGYNGAWDTYELNKAESVTVGATYSPKTYTVVFVADGKTVATVEYKYNDTSINAPVVPEKEGYEGVWESYELNKAESITVNAVYTAVEVEKPSLWWLWTSLGVVGVGAAALITYLTKKKKG